MATVSGTPYTPSFFWTSRLHLQQFGFHRKPILRFVSSASSPFYASDSISISRRSEFAGQRRRSRRRFDLQVAPSSLHDEVNLQTNNTSDDPLESGTVLNQALLLAYKTAILNGDHKAVNELEDDIVLFEKKKTELNQKLSALATEISAEKEKCIRLQADFDNYRKRVEKERLGVKNDVQAEVIESLLPLIDSFERARSQIRVETELAKKIDASYQGIYKQFVEIMRSLKVSAIPTVGKPFNPSMHEAVARIESLQFREGIISQEIRRGFRFGERLLRPAMVKVSSGKKNTASVPEKPASVA